MTTDMDILATQRGKDINYLSIRDFNSFKTNLVQYIKSYYQDHTQILVKTQLV